MLSKDLEEEESEPCKCLWKRRLQREREPQVQSPREQQGGPVDVMERAERRIPGGKIMMP